MAKKHKLPSTPALRLLRARKVEFEALQYPYVDRGGTEASAAALELPLHHIVKTLVFEDQDRAPLVVLMHGDKHVSEKALARELGKKSVSPCAPAVAEKHSGYRVGGTSPFGTKRDMAVYAERSILALPWIVINGGARGVLVRISPEVLVDLLGVTPVDVAN